LGVRIPPGSQIKLKAPFLLGLGLFYGLTRSGDFECIRSLNPLILLSLMGEMKS